MCGVRERADDSGEYRMQLTERVPRGQAPPVAHGAPHVHTAGVVAEEHGGSSQSNCFVASRDWKIK